MKQKEYLIILGSALFIIIFWGIFTVYHNLSTSTIDPNENLIIVPINGSFDKNTINQVKNRKRVEVSLSSLKTIVATPTPTIKPVVKPSPTPIATASPTLEPTPADEP